jgi:hypothetical protein
MKTKKSIQLHVATYFLEHCSTLSLLMTFDLNVCLLMQDTDKFITIVEMYVILWGNFLLVIMQENLFSCM